MGEDAVNRGEIIPDPDPAVVHAAGIDDVPETATTDPWQVDMDALSPVPDTGMFSDEIEDIDASDWDATGIWSEDPGDVGIDDGGITGLDFSL